jgi:hypothetical protein
MKRYFYSLLLFTLFACGSDDYIYAPTPNFRIETVREDGTPVSVEVTYEAISCENDFEHPEYVQTDSEGSASISVSFGYVYQFYCESKPYYAYTCKTLNKKDRSITLVLE